MSVRRRARQVENTKEVMIHRGSILGSLTSTVPTSLKTEVTTDEITGWPIYKRLERDYPDSYSVGKANRMDWGGDFSSVKRSTTRYAEKRYNNTWIGNRTSQDFYFTGFMHPGLNGLSAYESGVNLGVPQIDRDNLVGLGATAIARCAPTNPVANANNFIGELLRDGIPRVSGASQLKERARFFRSLGEEYLNVEFGWKPFINDLEKLLRSVKDSERILAQYKRDSGRWIRRRYRFPTIEDVSTVYSRNVQAAPLGHSNSYLDATGYGLQSAVRKYTKDYWFSGAFTYYVDSDKDVKSTIARWVQEADKLLGVRITPELLWNLEPWSWFADWIANVGSIMTNVTRFGQDGLVMRYGYAMGQLDYRTIHTTSGVQWRNGTRSGPADLVISESWKLRQKATPFGFGLDPALDFSTRQWAIIASLGVTRGSRTAW